MNLISRYLSPILKDSALIAVKEVWVHPLRVGLALLGMIMGTTSLIGFDMLGRGTQQRIMSNMENLSNSRLIELQLEQQTKATLATRNYFNHSDEDLIKSRIPEIVDSSLQSLNWLVGFSHGRKRIPGHLYAVEPSYARVNNLSVKSGRFLTAIDEQNMNLVCVIGDKVSGKLYAGENPIGAELSIENYRFTVVGVLEQSPNRTVDESIYLPLAVAESRFEESRAVTTIAFQAVNITNLAQVKSRIDEIMRASFADRFPYYRVQVQDVAVARVMSSGRLLRISLLGLAGVLMLVGGVGIMNVEMAAVLERSREIGIRKAFGARDEDILMQLLLESSVLGLVSGFFGVALGIGLGKVLLWAIGLLSHSPLDAPVSFLTLIVAWLFAMVLGLLFGFVPALRGARLDLIEVIRNE